MSASHDDFILLTNDSMRARRRPLMMVVQWAFDAVLAVLVAWPVSSLVKAAYGSHPQGDAPLFRPGAHELMDLLSLESRSLSVAMSLLFGVLAVAAVVGLLPLAAMLTSIAHATRDRRAPKLRDTFVRAVRGMPSFTALLAVFLFVEIAVMAVGFLLSGVATSGLRRPLGEPRADQIGWLVLGLFILVTSIVGVGHDLARAAVMRFQVTTGRALKLAWNAFRRGPVSVTWSWMWRAIIAVVPPAIGAIVAGPLGGRGGFTLFLFFLLHQAIVIARIALRASWLARALRAVDEAHKVIRRN